MSDDTQCRCPECGALFAWTAAVASETAHQVIASLSRLPPRVAVLIPLYLGMFRSPSGALSFAQQRTVIAQLEPMIIKEQVDLVEHAGFLRRAASHAVWARGLESVIAARHKPDFSMPLTTNRYLLKTVYGLAEKQPAITVSTATPSPSGPREDPATVISAQVFSGEISAEEASCRLRAIGLNASQIQILIGVPNGSPG